MDIEAKEQAKYAFLRNQANKRNLENLNKQIDYEAKETNKIVKIIKICSKLKLNK